ncbi:MAG: nucleotide exchange factor GrpE [Dehalococcoidales bacterium]|jgi:molecular chaperone GrpE|nr:nucleotide exchange factor GrpE [Dehalococcoidales bacterium]
MTKENNTEEQVNCEEIAKDTTKSDVKENKLEVALAEEKTKAESYLENWKITQADFINYKRRTEQEKEDIIKFANSVLILALLPILDDLQLALESIPDNSNNLQWIEGIKLIERKFNASLESQGVTAIKTIGEVFDPNSHEAALHVDGKEGIVIKELKKGYKMQNRVIRPAMVAVGNGNKQ